MATTTTRGTTAVAVATAGVAATDTATSPSTFATVTTRCLAAALVLWAPLVEDVQRNDQRPDAPISSHVGS